MKNSIAAPKMENLNLNPNEIYTAFLNNLSERADEAVGVLSDKIAEETDPAKVLELQKELKRARRKWEILCRMQDGVSPLSMLEIVSAIAEPGVKKELQPVLDTIIDLRDAVGLTENDLRGMKHE